ncbi:cation:proton antiporter regulatory subunit [Halofilum ochraceum]|uniref:cation:proton antiporter regulatory subunit n=1 Tax=Halofilum ochraceum TaxID=1611323 RepID=UPI003CCC105B
MTVSKGYGVSEIYIPEGSNFVGLTVTETKLSEQDINVLTLYRGSKVIPNPKYERVLEGGDKLLCYGKLESMRRMVPVKARRRRRPEVKTLDTEVGT